MQLRPTTQEEVVDCDGCTACCRGDVVMLQPGESPLAYDVEPAHDPISGQPGHKLKLGADGNCNYLGATGCAIHARRPRVCRSFSCVGLVERLMETIPRQSRRRMLRDGQLDAAIWEAGSRRLEARR